MPDGITFFDALEVQAARCGIMPNELYLYTPEQLYNVFHAHTLDTRERWELARFANPQAAKVKFPWEGSGVFFTEKERRKIEAYIEQQKAMGY